MSFAYLLGISWQQTLIADIFLSHIYFSEMVFATVIICAELHIVITVKLGYIEHYGD